MITRMVVMNNFKEQYEPLIVKKIPCMRREWASGMQNAKDVVYFILKNPHKDLLGDSK